MKTMRRLFPLLAIGFTVASLLIYWFGDYGVVALRSLAQYRDRLHANVENLTALNLELTTELSSLRTDPERTEVLARDLGLYNGNDRVIRLEKTSSRSTFFEVGNILKLSASKAARNPFLKILGFCSVGIFVAFLIIRSTRGSRKSASGTARAGRVRDYPLG
jgi:cell division protein FtsB